MESPQKDLLGVLLKKLMQEGLLPPQIYSGAVDIVHSMADIPDMFSYPVCFAKEGHDHEHTQDTK